MLWMRMRTNFFARARLIMLSVSGPSKIFGKRVRTSIRMAAPVRDSPVLILLRPGEGKIKGKADCSMAAATRAAAPCGGRGDGDSGSDRLVLSQSLLAP